MAEIKKLLDDAIETEINNLNSASDKDEKSEVIKNLAAELVLPLMFYGVWMRRGLRFEETGTFTSQTFKNLFNRFKPTRKS